MLRANLLVLFSLLFSHPAIAQSLDIKGIRIGMLKSEVEERFPNLQHFTIAGVVSKYDGLGVTYHDGRVDGLSFFFYPEQFSIMLDALKEKYPKIACKSSKVSNAMGASFEQTECMLSDTVSVLHLTRYVSDVRTSALGLVSRRLADEQFEKIKKQKKDI